MKTIKWNGEFWYEDRTPMLARLATWLVWVGGTLRNPAPVALFGHRIVYSGWGMHLRLPSGDLLVVSWHGLDPERYWRTMPARIYVSPNGTPDRATTWLLGEPREVREAVERVGSRRAFRNWRPEVRS